MTSLRVLVKSYVEEQKTIKAKITTYFIKFHEEIINMLNIYSIVKRELKNESATRIYIMKLMEFEQAYITRILEDGYDAGQFREIEREDIPWFSETMIAAFFGIVNYSIEKEQEQDIEKLEKIVRILIPKVFG